MLTAIPQYIEIRKNCDGQDRAYLAGTRIKVQDLVIYHERMGQSVADLARGFPHLSLAQIHAAFAYYYSDPDVIKGHIRDDEAFVESMKGTMVSMSEFLRAQVSSR